MRWRFFVAAAALTFVALPAAAQDDDALAEAKRQFRAGVNLLDDPDGAKYEEAYHAFKKAYELSKNPKVLGNIGFCAMHLERDGEAIDAYTSYLRDATDIEDRERQQIQRDLATLGSTIAKVKIVVRRPGTGYELIDTRLQTRGSSVENSYAMEGTEIAVRVRPGRHVFKVKGAGVESLPLETTIEPATDVSAEIAFPKPRPPAPVVVRSAPSRVGPILLGAVGVAALGTGIVTGIMGRSAGSNIENACPNDECPATYDLGGERTRAKTFGTIADTSFIAGGALVGGAVVWWLLQNRAGSSRTGSTKWPLASAMCTSTGCGFTLERGF